MANHPEAKHDQRDNPLDPQVSEGEITVTDSGQPLYGGTVKLNGFAFLLGHIRHCQVEIQSGRVDCVPLASTKFIRGWVGSAAATGHRGT
jgi:hypothetical protein